MNVKTSLEMSKDISKPEQLITEHIDIWTSAILAKSSSGRGSSKKYELYGITKLRGLILDLAVRGKLVPQDANDEPASVLLEKMANEKKLLIQTGQIRKKSELLKINNKEKSFNKPKGWEWIKLGELGYWASGNGFPKKEQGLEGLEILFCKVSDMNLEGNDKFIRNTVNTVSKQTASRLKLNIHPKGTVVFPKIGGAIATNKRRVIESPTVIDNNCLGITPSIGVKSEYLLLLLKSIDMTEYQSGTSIPSLSLGNIESIDIGLPPLAEQKRIVAKVDELMLLCDQLEQQAEASIEAHATLVEVLLATLTDSVDADELAQNWARISEHFDSLFTTEQSIEALKQTVLQLAVMGKLVPQNPDDEPASVLLEKIAEEKEQLIKEKKIKKEKSLQSIGDEEKLFELPRNWVWCRLGSLIPQFQNGASSRGDKDGRPIIVLRLADIKNWQISLTDTRTLPISTSSIERYLLETGDILVIRVNGSADIVGRFITCKHDYDAIYCDHFIRMRFPIRSFVPEYLSILGSSSIVRDKIADLFISTAGQKTINQGHLSSILIPLPPLAEQQRIVAKVDELMAICDQLKEKLKQSQETQVQLTDALVDRALG